MKTIPEALLAGHLILDPRTIVRGCCGGQTAVESSRGVCVVQETPELVAAVFAQVALGPTALRTLQSAGDWERISSVLCACGQAFQGVWEDRHPWSGCSASVVLLGIPEDLAALTRRLDAAGMTVQQQAWGTALPPALPELSVIVALLPEGVPLTEVDGLERQLRGLGRRFFLAGCVGLGVLIGPSNLAAVGCQFLDAYAELAGAAGAPIVENFQTRQLPHDTQAIVMNVIEARVLDLIRAPGLRGSGGRVDLVDWNGTSRRYGVYDEYRMHRDPSVCETGELPRLWRGIDTSALVELLVPDSSPPAPPATQPLTFLRSHGAHLEKDERSGRTQYDHLLGTYRILMAWGVHHPLAVFGLFHSIYASQALRRPLLSLHDRALVATVIGPATEELVFLFSSLDRESLLRSGDADELGVLRNFATGETLQSPELFAFFEFFELVNRCDLAQTPHMFPELSRQVRALRSPRWTPPVFDRGSELVSESAVRRAIDLANPWNASLQALEEVTELVPWWPEPHIRYAAELALKGDHAQARQHGQVGLERLSAWGTSFDSRATWEQWMLVATKLAHGDRDAIAAAISFARRP